MVTGATIPPKKLTQGRKSDEGYPGFSPRDPGWDSGRRAWPFWISRPGGRAAMEEIRRDYARGQPDQGTARRAAAAARGRVHRAHRHQGRLGGDPGAAAAPEGGHRADLRTAELRRGARELSCAEAPIRQGGLACRPFRFAEGPEPHDVRPDRR